MTCDKVAFDYRGPFRRRMALVFWVYRGARVCVSPILALRRVYVAFILWLNVLFVGQTQAKLYTPLLLGQSARPARRIGLPSWTART